eukprot:CAMPEP_0113703470 /NCGR_PEP_ID=MMETSP0038_2-20120614/25876_1 /TAXON_ID=2898 /ORGANISM="Cryptomonas paramecium" /LENGTH=186 /DNA_ID=CAMNT_0000627933 /DNA_START=420 /DNA_END=977 /DNA_ORIENTATION=- /assembly_acc=CAM_ASM_000170
MAQSLSSYWLWLRRSLVSWARAVPMLSATLLGSLLFAGPMLAVTLFGGMLVLLVETLDAMSRLLHKSIVRWCTVTNEEAQASPGIDDSWNIGFESCCGEMQVPAVEQSRLFRGNVMTCGESPSGICFEEHSKVQLVVKALGKRFTLHAPLHATEGHVKKAIQAAVGMDEAGAWGLWSLERLQGDES